MIRKARRCSAEYSFLFVRPDGQQLAEIGELLKTGSIRPVIDRSVSIRSSEVQGSKEASQLGRYMSAVGKYLHTGDTDALEEFEGQSIAGHALITDAETLGVLAQAGALQLDEIYALPESSSGRTKIQFRRLGWLHDVRIKIGACCVDEENASSSIM